MDNNTWIWTDELIIEFTKFASDNLPNYYVTALDIKRFKQSKQKQYPPGILSFRLKPSQGIYTLQKNGKYGATIEDSQTAYRELRHLITDTRNYEIWSVQNGDEILTVGDEVYYQKLSNPNWRIDEFYITHDMRLLARSLSCDHVEEINKDLIKVTKQKTYTASGVQGVV